MPTTRFCQLIGIPERTYRRWQAHARAGRPAKGPWPQPARQASREVITGLAGRHGAWGHRKVWAMARHSVLRTRYFDVQGQVWQLVGPGDEDAVAALAAGCCGETVDVENEDEARMVVEEERARGWDLVRRVPVAKIDLEVGYDLLGAVMRLVRPPAVELAGESYGDAGVTVTLAVRADHRNEVAAQLADLGLKEAAAEALGLP